MTTWNPRNAFSGFTCASAEPAGGLEPPARRFPLGFADVRSVGSPAVPALPAPALPFGFAPATATPAPAADRFLTEVSFRRDPRAVVRAGMVPGGETPGHGMLPVGHAASEPYAGSPEPAEPADVDAAQAVVDDPSAPEAPSEEKRGAVPFYKREITFGRKKESKAIADETDGDESSTPLHKRELSFKRRRQASAAEPGEGSVADAPAEVVAEIAEEPVTESWPMPTEGPSAEAVEVAAEPAGGAGDAVADHVTVEEETAEVTASADEPSLEVDSPGDGLSAEAENEVLPPDVPSEPETERSSRTGRPGSLVTKPVKRDRGNGGRGRRVVGLKVGTSQLAAAVVVEGEGRHELVQLVRVPIEPGIVVDAEVRDPVALTNAIRSLFEEHRLPRKDVRIGLASNRIGVRTLEIGGIDDPARFDNAVRFKAHEVLPVAFHESVLDYRVVEEKPTESGELSRTVLLVVAPRDQVEPYVKICADAGVRLSGIDLEALGLLRAFVDPTRYQGSDDTATVIVSIGHDSTTLLVAGGGACAFTRVFDWGASMLEESIASELGVARAEASTILRHLSLSGPGTSIASLGDDDRAKATDAVRARLTPFARELVTSLQFYQTQPDSLGIGEIVITGGTSHLEGLADALHKMIGVSVRVGDPLARVVSSAEIPDSLHARIGSTAVAIGLAIEDEPFRTVNLLPDDLRTQSRRRPSVLALAAPVAAVVPLAALAFMFAQARGDVNDQQAKLDTVRTQIAALPEPSRPTIDPALGAEQSARALAVATVLGGRLAWEPVFRDISRVLPGNVSLEHVQAQAPVTPAVQVASATTAAPVTPTGVSIDGYTYTHGDIARLLGRLQAVPSLRNVMLQTAAVDKIAEKKVIRFTILADLNGGAQ